MHWKLERHYGNAKSSFADRILVVLAVIIRLATSTFLFIIWLEFITLVDMSKILPLQPTDLFGVRETIAWLVATRGKENIFIFRHAIFYGKLPWWVMVIWMDNVCGHCMLMPGHVTLAVKGSMLKPPTSALCKGIMIFEKEAKCPTATSYSLPRGPKRIPAANQI